MNLVPTRGHVTLVGAGPGDAGLLVSQVARPSAVVVTVVVDTTSRRCSWDVVSHSVRTSDTDTGTPATPPPR